ncbi:major capsid family protein [Elusimicrobium simillimum]|uniref:major capsid family protein n=1 Tax=Elusimicrobium simillimum TaxID=3143438 RepID=UPI003C7010E9
MKKENWDLGIQKHSFLGSENDTNRRGLLNLDNVNSDLTTITKPISQMTPAEYNTFVATIIGKYRENCEYTTMPTDFYIPESDYMGLGASLSAEFPLTSKIEYLRKVMSDLGLVKVNIKPLVYCDQNRNSLGLNRYVMLNKNPDTLAFNIPVDYTSTLANSINGFNWENAAYGQFSTVKAYRPKEVLYFDFAN